MIFRQLVLKYLVLKYPSTSILNFSPYRNIGNDEPFMATKKCFTTDKVPKYTLARDTDL